MDQRRDIGSQITYWNQWHDRAHLLYSHWGEPFPFAKEILPIFEEHGVMELADLACGQGNDTFFFAQHHIKTFGVDFSTVAIEKANAIKAQRHVDNVCFIKRDLAMELPFSDSSIDAAYSHLGLHYFEDETTQKLFGEIRRALRGGGVLAFLVKSTDDMAYGIGDEVGPDIFNDKGHVRHFFRKQNVAGLLASWRIDMLEECQSYAEGAKEPNSFIKVVAYRPQE